MEGDVTFGTCAVKSYSVVGTDKGYNKVTISGTVNLIGTYTNPARLLFGQELVISPGANIVLSSPVSGQPTAEIRKAGRADPSASIVASNGLAGICSYYDNIYCGEGKKCVGGQCISFLNWECDGGYTVSSPPEGYPWCSDILCTACSTAGAGRACVITILPNFSAVCEAKCVSKETHTKPTLYNAGICGYCYPTSLGGYTQARIDAMPICGEMEMQTCTNCGGYGPECKIWAQYYHYEWHVCNTKCGTCLDPYRCYKIYESDLCRITNP